MFTPRRTALLLLIVTALLYAPTLTYGFVYEDANDLQTFVQPIGERLGVWAWQPARSLTQITFAVTYQVFGLWPGAYHAGNLALHLLNGGLLYGLASSLLQPWAAVVAVGVFLLHPVQVESVAYVSSRPDLVATTALLFGLWAVVAGRWWAVLLCGVLAVLAKETAVVGLPLFALVAWWRGVRVSRLVVIAAALVSVPIGTFLLLRYPVSLDLELALSQLTAWTWLLSRIVLPVGLSIDPDWNWITHLPMSLTAGVWAALLVAAWQWRHSLLPVVVGGCFLIVAPRLVVPLVEGLHAHHLMFAMPLVALLIGAWIAPESDRYGVSASSA